MSSSFYLSTVGHGLSDGVKAHVDSIDEYVVDVLNHVHLMREEHPQIPVFAVGHSMVHFGLFYIYKNDNMLSSCLRTRR